MRTVGAGPDGTMPAPLNRPFWYVPRGLSRPPRNALARLARQHPHRTAGQGPCGRRNSLGPIQRTCPKTPKACTQPTPRASATCNKQTCPTTCPSSTLGPSIASTARARQLDLLLRHAQTENLPCISCTQQYEHALAHKSQNPRRLARRPVTLTHYRIGAEIRRPARRFEYTKKTRRAAGPDGFVNLTQSTGLHRSCAFFF